MNGKTTEKNGDLPHYHGHRRRLREKFAKYGADSLRDYELLELLLTFAIPRRDVKPAAKALIGKFGGIQGVLDAPCGELMKVPGISSGSAVLLSLCRELCSKYLSEKMSGQDALSSPSAVSDFARMKLAHLSDEVMLVIYVNTKNKVIDHEIVDRGTVDSAVIYPRKIVRKSLEKNASGVILVHNHPSGECEPSNDDIRLTKTVREALKTVDIRLLDHLIAGKSGYFSFAEKNVDA